MKLWRTFIAVITTLIVAASAFAPARGTPVMSGPRLLVAAPGGGATDPAWFTALADREGTYRGPAGGVEAVRPAGVSTSLFDDIMVAWNGGVLNQQRLMFTIMNPAGHTNWDGGANFSYDIINEVWFQHTVVNNPVEFGPVSDGITVDGTPQANHSYDEVVAVGDEVWEGSMGSVDRTDAGQGSNQGWVWNYAFADSIPFSSGARGWTALGLNTLDGSNDTGAVAYDPVTDRVYYCKRFTGGGTHQLASWNRSTKARTEHIATGFANFGGSGGDMTAAVIYSGGDSVFLGMGDNGVRTIDLQDLLVGSTAWQTPTMAGVVPGTGKVRVHFVPETNQLVTWEIGTNNLLVANVPANFHSGTFTWFRVTLTGATITQPSGPSQGETQNGTFGRFQVFRMPSGRIAVFLVNATNEKVYIAKLPVAAMSFAAEPVIRQLDEIWAGDAANEDQMRLAA